MFVTGNETKDRKGLLARAYSVGEVAESLGVSQGLVRLEIQRGRLRALHVGRRVIITPEALDRWLKGSNEQEG